MVQLQGGGYTSSSTVSTAVGRIVRPLPGRVAVVANNNTEDEKGAGRRPYKEEHNPGEAVEPSKRGWTGTRLTRGGAPKSGLTWFWGALHDAKHDQDDQAHDEDTQDGDKSGEERCVAQDGQHALPMQRVLLIVDSKNQRGDSPCLVHYERKGLKGLQSRLQGRHLLVKVLGGGVGDRVR